MPIINFKTEDKKFFSTIDEGIQTNTGTSSEADLEFYIPNEIVILTTASSDPKSYFIKEVESGNVKIETLAGEAELFSKGYLNFYGSLTSN